MTIFVTIDYLGKDKPYDLRRTAAMSGVGLLFSGPWMHLMYSKVLPRLVPSTSSFLAFKKLAIDQTAGATFMVSGALLTANVLRGKDLAASVKDT